MKLDTLTRQERHEVTAATIGAAMLRAYRMTLPDETGRRLRQQVRGRYMDRQTALAEYRRLGKAAEYVFAACGMEWT